MRAAGSWRIGRAAADRSVRRARFFAWAVLGGRRSAGSAHLEDLKIFVKPLVRLRGTGLHSRLEHPIAVFQGVEDRGARERRFAVLFLQRQSVYGDVAGHALPLERPHDSLRPHDLAELAAESGDLAVGTAVDDPPRAARTEVHLAAAELVLPRAPPVRDRKSTRL